MRSDIKILIKDCCSLSFKVREAILYQIGCFFSHCVKGEGGSNPGVKIYVVDFYNSGGFFTTLNWHKTYFPALYCHNFRVHLTFFPQICAIVYKSLSREMFTHFLKFMLKNPQHDRVKRGGGGQGPFTQCVKKHPIW